MMTPQQFIEKWRSSQLRERQGSQEHFLDLCELLEEPRPAEVDPEGNSYCFDYGAEKTGGGGGYADVWKRGCFGWEYKGKHKDLTAAYVQLKDYVDALQNPPLLIVSDMDTILIHSNFTNTVHEVHKISLDDLLLPEKRRLLKWAFSEPERLRPGMTREDLTQRAAAHFAELAQGLRDKGYEPQRVAHFMNKLLFCLFAEHIGILPANLFTNLLKAASRRPQEFQPMAKDLFGAMKDGGRFGYEVIDWFNGGLFDDDDTLPLGKSEVDQILKISQLDWSEIEPSIFGTLFERGLDPSKRSQLGAHFTDQRSIMRIVEPVVLAPLREEWAATRKRVADIMAKYSATKHNGSAKKLLSQAKELCREFLHRLEGFRVLDPACGSGNFLYLSLLGLKGLEHQAISEAAELVFERFFPVVGPQAVMGIELNLYAAELARVTIWIGQIQWMLRHGWGLSKQPILQKLDQISCRDAVLNSDGTEAEWPAADCIVGNPPFLGDKKMISELGENYTNRLRAAYEGRVPASADLVAYWFRKAWQHVERGAAARAGLVATQSIRKGSNRLVLEQVAADGEIFNAWSDEPWVVDGAAVRVSIVCFGSKSDPATEKRFLNGTPVQKIFSDLGAQFEGQRVSVDFTQARRLAENANVCFQGPVKVGPFEVPGELARRWLTLPSNPDGRPNAGVLKPRVNGMDISRRPSDTWIIDFGVDTPESSAALYERPFEYVLQHVKPARALNKDDWRRSHWWLLGRSGEDFRAAVAPLRRYIGTPRVAKHRFFVWLDRTVLPDSRISAIVSDDAIIFGILQSRFHLAWALATSSRHGVGNDPTYNSLSVFETFPFPDGLSPNTPASQFASNLLAMAIGEAARHLDQLRESWLNPPELVKRVPEVVPGFPDRLIPVNDKAAQELKKRTLTNLYNQRPAWLANAHQALDEAVAAAYGWTADIAEEEALRRLLDLNLSRAGKQNG